MNMKQSRSSPDSPSLRVRVCVVCVCVCQTCPGLPDPEKDCGGTHGWMTTFSVSVAVLRRVESRNVVQCAEMEAAPGAVEMCGVGQTHRTLQQGEAAPFAGVETSIFSL